MLKTTTDQNHKFISLISPYLLLLVLLGGYPMCANAQIFEPTVNLSNDFGAAEDHQIDVNGNNIYVVWSDDTSGNMEILLRRSTDGGATWQPVQNISETAITSRNAHIGVSGNNLYIVWDEYTDFFSSHVIMFRRSTDGGVTFKPSQQLSETSAARQCFANIAATGNIVFPFWLDCNFSSTFTLLYKRSPDAGATFDPMQTLTPGGSGTSQTKVVANGNNVYVVSAVVVSGANQLILRRSTNGGATFEPTKVISPTFANNLDAVVSGSNLYVVWTPQIGNGANGFFTRSSDNGDTFSPPINLTNNPSDSSAADFCSQLAIVDQNIYVLCGESYPVSGNPPFPTATTLFFVKSADNGATFTPKLNLSNNRNVLWARLAASGDMVNVVWYDWDGVTPNTLHTMLRTSNDRGVTFDVPINLSGDGRSTYPDVINSNGNVYVIWRSYGGAGGSFDIFFRRSTPRPQLLTYENSERAIALDSVTMVRDPFPIATTLNFSQDHRTRVMLFAVNANLLPGENASAITAQAEDSQRRIYPLVVEFAGRVPNFDWLTQINVKLPDELTNVGDVKISINLHGLTSNQVVISIKPSGSSAP